MKALVRFGPVDGNDDNLVANQAGTDSGVTRSADLAVDMTANLESKVSVVTSTNWMDRTMQAGHGVGTNRDTGGDWHQETGFVVVTLIV